MQLHEAGRIQDAEESVSAKSGASRWQYKCKFTAAKRARSERKRAARGGGATGGTQADARGYLSLLETTQCLEQITEIASHAVQLLHDTVDNRCCQWQSQMQVGNSKAKQRRNE